MLKLALGDGAPGVAETSSDRRIERTCKEAFELESTSCRLDHFAEPTMGGKIVAATMPRHYCP